MESKDRPSLKILLAIRKKSDKRKEKRITDNFLKKSNEERKIKSHVLLRPVDIFLLFVRALVLGPVPHSLLILIVLLILFISRQVLCDKHVFLVCSIALWKAKLWTMYGEKKVIHERAFCASSFILISGSWIKRTLIPFSRVKWRYSFGSLGDLITWTESADAAAPVCCAAIGLMAGSRGVSSTVGTVLEDAARGASRRPREDSKRAREKGADETSEFEEGSAK